MAIPLVVYLSIASLVTAFTHVDYGNFVYETKGRHAIKLVLNTTHDGYGLFYIECGRRRFQGDWFPLTVVEHDPHLVVLHEFPNEKATLHKYWLQCARATCPKLEFRELDFLEFMVDNVDYGTFVYEVKKPHPFKLTFTTTHDHYGLFVVQCGKKRFHDNWLKLTVDEDNVYDAMLHEFPETPYWKMQQKRWVDRVRETCPKITFDDADFQYWFINPNGDVATQIGGKEVFVPRQWFPLIPGRYWSEPSITPFRMKFDIHPDGTAFVIFGCEGGDTGGYRRFNLVKKGDDGRYELTAVKGRSTVKDLIDTFRAACPDLWHPRLEEDLKSVRFANYDQVYVMESVGSDRLFRNYVR
ncbi:hypothetical protein FOL46_002362 [Perkinsus olseni]|uniref:Uncharacterized protein n=1 Tax=Perkinsus olseni TaxID=32597 RepID=A0A7J6M9L1_PEROL|nr:hypothetical protein FOL46_002362 [Perkinsus olseni]